ncbi:hypothetical protein SDC9_114838 [bioreactor metagenome]|uniref:Uncharacterized protein n=1 Tax=bioreactor metagenome TaxID=1076179 RepID=A0A645BXR9_9ZZZZ
MRDVTDEAHELPRHQIAGENILSADEQDEQNARIHRHLHDRHGEDEYLLRFALRVFQRGCRILKLDGFIVPAHKRLDHADGD